MAVSLLALALVPCADAEQKTQAVARINVSLGNQSSPLPSGVTFEALCQYDFGESRKVLSTIEENIRIASPEQLEAIEGLLLDVLKTDSATYAGKLFACRMLRRMGTERCVPILAGFLADEKLSDPARFALQGLPCPEVDQVLREALNNLTGNLRLGVISSIAARKDREAVDQLSKWIQSDNTELARASIHALGRIGGAEAAEILWRADTADELDALRLDACLLCADTITTEGETAAKKIYQEMTGAEKPIMIRAAAYGALIKLEKDNAVSTIIALLQDKNPELQRAASGPFIKEIADRAIAEAFMKEFLTASPDTQVSMLGILASRGIRSAMPTAVYAAKRENEAVRLAGVQALGALGDSTTVELLLNTAIAGGPLGEAAAQSLIQLQGIYVEAAMLDGLRTSSEQARAALIRCLTARRGEGAASVLLEYMEDTAPMVREECLKGLSVLAEVNEIPELLRLLAKAPDEQTRKPIQDVVHEAAIRARDPQRRTQVFLTAFHGAPVHLRVALIQLLGEFGGREALDKVGYIVLDPNEQIRDAAFYALAAWPDAMPLRKLLTLVQSTADPEKRMVALRGCLRMIKMDQDRPIENILKDYNAALQAASLKKEKALIFGEVSKQVNFAALDFLESYLTDPVLGAEAREAYRSIINKLQASTAERSQWKVEASVNTQAAGNAIDGRSRTRWDTGQVQTPGLWYLVDLGMEQQIEKITLDSTHSSGDYPRGYEVYIANDKENMNDPVVKGNGEKPVTEIDIPSKNGRFIKIVLTESIDESLYWSIHELNVSVSSDTEKFKSALEKLERASQ